MNNDLFGGLGLGGLNLPSSIPSDLLTNLGLSPSSEAGSNQEPGSIDTISTTSSTDAALSIAPNSPQLPVGSRDFFKIEAMIDSVLANVAKMLQQLDQLTPAQVALNENLIAASQSLNTMTAQAVTAWKNQGSVYSLNSSLNATISSFQSKAQQIEDKMNQAIAAYKDGQITQGQYQQAVNNYNSEKNALDGQYFQAVQNYNASLPSINTQIQTANQNRSQIDLPPLPTMQPIPFQSLLPPGPNPSASASSVQSLSPAAVSLPAMTVIDPPVSLSTEIYQVTNTPITNLLLETALVNTELKNAQTLVDYFNSTKALSPLLATAYAEALQLNLLADFQAAGSLSLMAVYESLGLKNGLSFNPFSAPMPAIFGQQLASEAIQQAGLSLPPELSMQLQAYAMTTLFEAALIASSSILKSPPKQLQDPNFPAQAIVAVYLAQLINQQVMSGQIQNSITQLISAYPDIAQLPPQVQAAITNSIELSMLSISLSLLSTGLQNPGLLPQTLRNIPDYNSTISSLPASYLFAQAFSDPLKAAVINYTLTNMVAGSLALETLAAATLIDTAIQNVIARSAANPLNTQAELATALKNAFSVNIALEGLPGQLALAAVELTLGPAAAAETAMWDLSLINGQNFVGSLTRILQDQYPSISKSEAAKIAASVSASILANPAAYSTPADVQTAIAAELTGQLPPNASPTEAEAFALAAAVDIGLAGSGPLFSPTATDRTLPLKVLADESFGRIMQNLEPIIGYRAAYDLATNAMLVLFGVEAPLALAQTEASSVPASLYSLIASRVGNYNDPSNPRGPQALAELFTQLENPAINLFAYSQMLLNPANAGWILLGLSATPVANPSEGIFMQNLLG